MKYAFACIIILFILGSGQAHLCNITDTINRGSFFLSRCTFEQHESAVNINMTFVVLNDTGPYNNLADSLQHYLVYDNGFGASKWFQVGEMKFDTRVHKLGEIIEFNTTMSFKNPYADEPKYLDWRSRLYCSDFYPCGTNTRYQISMPWESPTKDQPNLKN